MYPKYKFHKTEGSKLVHSEAEEKELGKDWAESPAEFGVITAPSLEQIEEAKAKAEEKVEAKAESKKAGKA